MIIKAITISIAAALLTFNAGAQVKKTTTAKKAVITKKPAAVKPKTTVKSKVVILPAAIDTASRVRIVTDSGTIIVKLYDSTPLHRDNFIKLVSEHFYDSLMFHRVIPAFMIQGGDPLSKNAPQGAGLGSGGGDLTRIPAEFRSSLFHKRGALAAARDGNPEKASSACQFYIVQGKPVNDQELNMMESRNGIKYTAAQRKTYNSIGGTPFLDQGYTVFGEVESGLEVIDKIAGVPRDAMDRPLGDVRMYMEVVKKSPPKK